MNRWTLFSLLRRIADAFAVLSSFAAGYLIYHLSYFRSVPYTLEQFLGIGVAASVIYLIVFNYSHLYERESSLLHVAETRRLLLAWAFGGLILLGFSFYTRALDFSRLMITSSLVISFFFLLVVRAIVYQVGLKMLTSGKPYRLAAIFGAGIVGRHLYKRIFHSPALGIKVLGFLDDDTTLWGKSIFIREVNQNNGNFVLGGFDKIEALVKEKGLGEVFVALPSATYQRNLEIVDYCRKLGLKVSVVPPTYGNLMHKLDVRELGGIPVIQEKEIRPKYVYPVIKRIFDLILSTVAVVILSPFFIAISIAVKLDSEGPILFKQKRIGKNGKEFDFYKFRSMHVTANPYGLTPTSSSDPRITKFGRWLRRSSLDELPQFFNVLRGDMSLVGPRPEMPFIVATYNEEQRERLKVKPGITGVWQISAVRGEPIHANMEYDLFYIEHRSLLLDFIIIVKTIGTAIRGIGAV